jgi:beta-alanine--pyruvate transaminase
MEAFETAFDAGLLIRVTGDIIALSPPLIIDLCQGRRWTAGGRDAPGGADASEVD